MTYKLTLKYELKRVAQFQRNGISLLFPLQRDFFPRVRKLTRSVELEGTFCLGTSRFYLIALFSAPNNSY